MNAAEQHILIVDDEADIWTMLVWRGDYWHAGSLGERDRSRSGGQASDVD